MIPLVFFGCVLLGLCGLLTGVMCGGPNRSDPYVPVGAALCALLAGLLLGAAAGAAGERAGAEAAQAQAQAE